MGLFSRISNLLGSKTAALLDEYEDPGEALDFAHEQMRDELSRVDERLTTFVTQKKRLERKRSDLETDIQKYNEDARAAVANDDEETARTLLKRKKAITEEVNTLSDQIIELESVQEELVGKRTALKNRIQTFESEKEILKAQLTAEQSVQTVDQLTTDTQGHKITDALNRVEDATETAIAREEAIEELTESGAFDDKNTLDEQIDALSTDAEIDDEIDALRSEQRSDSDADQTDEPDQSDKDARDQ